MSTPNPPAARSTDRGFWALNLTQFQGAFNDNMYQFTIIFFFVAQYATTAAGVVDSAYAMRLQALTTILAATPFLLLPGLTGALADRYSKRTIVIGTKVWEVGVMCVGLAAFYLGAPALILVLLFMMFMQSAFFGPAKYGILPEMMPEQRLSWANGYVGLFTFIAIILGMNGAGWLSDQVAAETLSVYHVSALLIVLSCLGLVTSFGVTPVPAASPGRPIPINPWSGLARYYRTYWGDKTLWLTMLGGAYFWFAGAVVRQTVVIHGKDALQSTDMGATLLVTALLIGIGLGFLCAGFVSRRKIELGLIPLGLIGMTVVGFILAVPGFGYNATFALLVAMGFFAGFFAVPLMATIQHRSPREVKGGMIAAFNMATWVGILLGGAFCLAAGHFALSTHTVFLLIALGTLGVCIYLCLSLPYFFLRSVLVVIMNTFYRIKLIGRDNVPETGGALLVANHTTYIDALFLGASIDRPIRFIMSSEFAAQNRWVKPIATAMRAIFISPRGTPKELVQSLREATQAIRDGELVCIFAEGQVSRSGQVLAFKKGFERIMKGVDAPIIPVHLDRLWGSVFSFSEDRVLWKRPKRIPYPVTVSYGAAMPGDATAWEVRTAIRELGTEAYMERKIEHPLLHRGFIRNARRRPGFRALADATTGEMSYLKALIASIIFARKLQPLIGKQEMVGVLLPPTVGCALTNLALLMSGRVPVNLNYTASAEAIASAARRCKITHTITAHAFLEKLPLQVPGEPVYLEDVKKSVQKSDQIKALLAAIALPAALLERFCGSRRRMTQDDVATVIFSSGSEGEPKGVPLTHFNISSNVEATVQVFPIEKDEAMMGFLPLFHSFGFTGTLWLPLLTGFTAVFHPTPLEPKAISALVYQYRCTFLVAAPTFLQAFIRRSMPEEFSSLKFVVTGAEKLPARIREAFRERFGVEPLEGYGTTECAPIVAVNVPDRRAPGYYQVGTRHGTIGQPIPGVSVRIVDPDTGERLGPDQPGMLLAKGPNIMKGYLGMPEKTAEVLHDGWYRTGDIAKVDEDGFITITDRLARFSKIGGEMAPHTHVEEVMHALLGLTELSLAVTGVPDRAKGERLVVLHTLSDEQIAELLRKLDKSELPKLWVPRVNNFHRVEAIPVLGTGKLDLRSLKELARSLDPDGGGDDA